MSLERFSRWEGRQHINIYIQVPHSPKLNSRQRGVTIPSFSLSLPECRRLQPVTSIGLGEQKWLPKRTVVFCPTMTPEWHASGVRS
jgi:hypothetical protein